MTGDPAEIQLPANHINAEAELSHVKSDPFRKFSGVEFVPPGLASISRLSRGVRFTVRIRENRNAWADENREAAWATN